MRPLPLLFVLLSAVLAAGAANAADLPTATPEEVGLSSSRLARITETLKADVEAGRIPGAVVIVARKGRIAYAEAVGFRDKAAGSRMTMDSIFRIASMTKPMVSVAAMMLYEDGRLFVSDPISKYIPALGKMQVGVERIDPMTGKSVLALGPADREMTIQDLLRHTSGLTYGNRGTTLIHQAYPTSSSAASREITSEEFIARLGKAPLLFQPGTKWEYSFSSDVLGRVVEVVSGKPLGVFLAERIFQPLAMSDTAFWVPAAKRERLAQPLATDPDTGKPVSVPDVTVPAKFECGGGCAVATAQRLRPIRPDDAQSRLARRRPPARAQDRRVHDVGSSGHDHRRRRLPAGARLWLRSGLRRAPRDGPGEPHRLVRRLQLGWGIRHRVLGRSERAAGRRVHDAGARRRSASTTVSC